MRKASFEEIIIGMGGEKRKDAMTLGNITMYPTYSDEELATMNDNPEYVPDIDRVIFVTPYISVKVRAYDLYDMKLKYQEGKTVLQVLPDGNEYASITGLNRSL